MIQKTLAKIKSLSYVIVVFVIALLIFIKPVSIQTIIPKDIVDIEIKYRVDGVKSNRVKIDDTNMVEDILGQYVYRKNLYYSFAMKSWYGDTLKIYFTNSNGRKLRLYVINHTLSGSILVLDSRLGLVYEVCGENAEELYNHLVEIINLNEKK